MQSNTNKLLNEINDLQDKIRKDLMKSKSNKEIYLKEILMLKNEFNLNLESKSNEILKEEIKLLKSQLKNFNPDITHDESIELNNEKNVKKIIKYRNNYKKFNYSDSLNNNNNFYSTDVDTNDCQLFNKEFKSCINSIKFKSNKFKFFF